MVGREAAEHQVGLRFQTPLARELAGLDLRAVSDQRQTLRAVAVVARHRSVQPLREPRAEMVAQASLGSTALRMEVAEADAPIRPARPEVSVVRAVEAMAAIRTQRERLQLMVQTVLVVGAAVTGRAELHPARAVAGLSSWQLQGAHDGLLRRD